MDSSADLQHSLSLMNYYFVLVFGGLNHIFLLKIMNDFDKELLGIFGQVFSAGSLPVEGPILRNFVPTEFVELFSAKSLT